MAAASHNPNKGQLEVQLGGAVTLQCPQGNVTVVDLITTTKLNHKNYQRVNIIRAEP